MRMRGAGRAGLGPGGGPARAEAILRSPDTKSDPEVTRVASFPPAIPENPYQQLLYDALRVHGIRLVECERLDLGWLRRSRRRADVLHFHWPAPFYRHERGPVPLRRCCPR